MRAGFLRTISTGVEARKLKRPGAKRDCRQIGRWSPWDVRRCMPTTQPVRLCSTKSYGIGQIIEVGGYGAMRKVKIRFANYGLKTFVADKVKLKVAPKKS